MGQQIDLWPTLPLELQQRIWRDLNDRDLRQCERVCRAWHQGINDANEQFWKCRVSPSPYFCRLLSRRGCSWRDISPILRPVPLNKYGVDRGGYNAPKDSSKKWVVAREISTICSVACLGLCISGTFFWAVSKALQLQHRLLATFVSVSRLRQWDVGVFACAQLLVMALIGFGLTKSVMSRAAQVARRTPYLHKRDRSRVLESTFGIVSFCLISVVTWPKFNGRLAVGSGIGLMVALAVAYGIGQGLKRRRDQFDFDSFAHELSKGGPSYVQNRELKDASRFGLLPKETIATALAVKHAQEKRPDQFKALDYFFRAIDR